MRGAFLIMSLIAFLVVGFLVIGNIRTEAPVEAGRVEKIEQGRKAAEQAENAMRNVREAVKKSSQ